MYSTLMQLSGFGYEDGVPTCPEDVWNSYIAKHRNGAKFKKHKLENFDELNELYSKSAATGAQARKASSLVYDYTGKMQSEHSLPPSLQPSPTPGPSTKPTNKKPANSESESSSEESEPVTAKRRRCKEESSIDSERGKPQKKPRQGKASATGKATTKKASQAGVKMRAERGGCKEKSAGKQLAGAIDEVADVSRQVDFRLERAIDLFHEEYHDGFSLRERFEGANLLGEDKNARIFLSLPEDDRDFWIERMIQGAL
jgi:hypothetical protein